MESALGIGHASVLVILRARSQRTSSHGHNAADPGTMRSLNPRVPDFAAGSMVPAPRRAKGTANSTPSPVYATSKSVINCARKMPIS